MLRFAAGSMLRDRERREIGIRIRGPRIWVSLIFVKEFTGWAGSLFRFTRQKL
jgi:hypothetical protein